MKDRLKNELKKGLVILLLAFFYYCLTQIFNIGIPCPFYKLTGFYCPGCGITRMCIALIHLKIREAFLYNPVCFTILPFIIALIIYHEYVFIYTGKQRASKIENIFLSILIMILILYGILRNVIL